MPESKKKEETRDLYIAQEGLVKRDGGPYLDQEERRIAEERRARKEGRKPDLDNPPPTVGTQLVTYDLLSEGHGSNPSQREFLDSPEKRKDFAPEVVATVPAAKPDGLVEPGPEQETQKTSETRAPASASK